MLQRFLDAGIILYENAAYCFYSNAAVIVLGTNSYIAEYVIPYYPEIYSLYWKSLQDN